MSVRENAKQAVALDPVRVAAESAAARASRKLWTAVILSPSLEVCEAAATRTCEPSPRTRPVASPAGGSTASPTRRSPTWRSRSASRRRQSRTWRHGDGRYWADAPPPTSWLANARPPNGVPRDEIRKYASSVTTTTSSSGRWLSAARAVVTQNPVLTYVHQFHRSGRRERDSAQATLAVSRRVHRLV